MGTAVVAERSRQRQDEAGIAGSSGSENHPLSIGEFGIGHLALLIVRPAKIAGLALTEARDGFRAERATARSTTAASRNSNACGNEQVQSILGTAALQGDLVGHYGDGLLPLEKGFDRNLSETLTNPQREGASR